MREVKAKSGKAVRVSGNVDGFEGTWLVGWAYLEGGAKPCVISVRDETGAEIAEGKASRQRPDLAGLNLGRNNLGFRIRVPDLGTTRRLRVFADGVALRGSPLPVGQGHFDGRIYVENGVVTGWVTERLQLFSPPKIDIAGPGGELVASVTAERDAKDAEPGFSPARFRVPLTSLFGGTDIEITARADGITFAQVLCDLRLVGNLEIATSGRCAGWIFSPDARSAQFTVEIRRDGELVVTAPLDVAREDVRAVHPDSNAFGFDVSLPRSGSSSEEPCELSLRFQGSDKELFGGPLIAGKRAGVVAAVQRLARSVHRTASPLSPAERSFLQRALADYAGVVRQGGDTYRTPRFAQPRQSSKCRLTIIIPVYRGVETTETCIRSVLSHRNAEIDSVLIVNDASPEPGMASLLAQFLGTKNLQLLTNGSNLGFVKTANRALRAVPEGDVVLLNSDTEVFAGAFDGMYRAAHSAPDIGTVTPLSNNATIFSYPHATLRRSELADMPWRRLAQVAAQRNVDAVVDVPTAHGFCMLIKREALDRVGSFDESFGRGYGEENDFCARAADLGFRNVATGGVLVYHRESVSFATEKAGLLTKNLATIAKRYPEYHASITIFEREDRMRSARWALDTARLGQARKGGAQFTLVVTNWLEGGTAESVRDITKACEGTNGRQLVLSCRSDGFLQLQCEEPLILARFSAAERRPLFRMLAAAAPALVAVHQILGYDAEFVRELADWIRDFRSVFYVHDYFAICPRVTMIDSSGGFCGKPSPDVCDRCVAIGGVHDASRLQTAGIEEHHRLTEAILGNVTNVVAPSADAARYINKVWPQLELKVISHPESERTFPANPRKGSDDEILVLGAIGAHKGSAKLLEITRLARLKYQQLQFRVVGYTDIDKQLLAVGNVRITGTYRHAELPRLMADCRGRLALFLHLWPETWSYTLSEAVAYGFVPLVPGIGAPAERVRETGFGHVFPFPIDAQEVLTLIRDIAEGRKHPSREGASPQAWYRSPEELAHLRALFAVTPGAPSDARVA